MPLPGSSPRCACTGNRDRRRRCGAWHARQRLRERRFAEAEGLEQERPGDGQALIVDSREIMGECASRVERRKPGGIGGAADCFTDLYPARWPAARPPLKTGGVRNPFHSIPTDLPPRTHIMLNLKTLAAGVTLAVASLGAFAQAALARGHAERRRPRGESAKRIDAGVASGLNAKETNRLDKQQARIASTEANAKADGKVTRRSAPPRPHAQPRQRQHPQAEARRADRAGRAEELILVVRCQPRSSFCDERAFISSARA